MIPRFVVALVFLGVWAHCVTAELLIDDFTSAPAEIVAGNAVTDPSTNEPVTEVSLRQDAVSDVPAGVRTLGIFDVNLFSAFGNSDAIVRESVDTAAGVLRVTSGHGVEEVGVSYGAPDAYLNLDITGYTGLVVSFRSYVSLPVDPSALRPIGIGMASGIGDNYQDDFIRPSLPTDFNGGDLFVPLSLFDKVDHSHLDVVTVSHSSSATEFAFEIDRIVFVPEPTSVTMLGIAMSGAILAYRRRLFQRTVNRSI